MKRVQTQWLDPIVMVASVGLGDFTRNKYDELFYLISSCTCYLLRIDIAGSDGLDHQVGHIMSL